MKRNFTAILILAILLATMVLFASCDDKGKKGSEGLEFYPYDDGSTYAVECGNAKYLNEIVIPEKYNGKPVSTIAKEGFAKCENLTSVVVPSSIKTIEENAFYNCEKLEKISISDMKSWCNISFSDAFANPLSNGARLYLNNTEVKSLTIPDSVTSIDNYVFTGCSSITEVKIHNKVTKIGYGAFSKCVSLTSVEIPNSVMDIGVAAFRNCSSLVNVTIPNSVSSINGGTFAFCTSLTSITIPNNIINIGDGAFGSCTSLTSIIIPDTVVTMDKDAFCLCGNLTIYCEAEEQPNGWEDDWNSSSCPVVWGYED